MLDRLDLAKKIAVEAGDLLKESFNAGDRIEYKLKNDKSFVTEKDTQIENFLIEKIKKNFPQDGFLGEEGANIEGESGYSWIIDPIDGTSNFIYKLPYFAVAMGITKSGFIDAGVINIPILNELYFVQKSGGFFIDNKKQEVSKTKETSKSLAVFSLAHKEYLHEINKKLYPVILDNVGKIRIIGSTSCELALIASGKVDAMIAVGISPWDVSAGVLMVREAGGKVIDFEGNEWNSGSKTIIATNEYLAPQFVEILKKVNISL